MAVENNARLMKVRQILFDETDENNHDLSIFEIIERLTKIFPDATFDKRTIKSDIELLDAMDFEVIRNKGERGKILYSHQSRKADPGTKERISIWEKIAEDRLYHQLREIGDTTKNINKFQRKRVMFSLFIVMLGVLAGMYVHTWLYLAGPLLGFSFYKMQLKKVDNFYRAWKFMRQLNFSKLTWLVIPYLKMAGGKVALYTIFNKILQRTEDESDKRSLYQLMGEMGDNPENLAPFTAFAERSSGTDMSHLFMSTIYDFQQSTFDVSVIDELGKMASEDMMNAIDEIMEMKLRRFNMFPTKVVMSSFIIVAGLGVGLMVDNFKDMDFGDGIMDPTVEVNQVDNTDSPSDEAERTIELDE